MRVLIKYFQYRRIIIKLHKRGMKSMYSDEIENINIRITRVDNLWFR